MSKEREDFEKLDEIAAILRDEDTHWCEKRNMYINQRVFQDSTTGYLNGAWYAWQAAKAKAVPELLKKFCNEHKDPAWRGCLTEYDKGYSDCCIAVLEMIKAQEPTND